MTAGPATGGLPLLIIGHGTRDATGVAQFGQLIGRVRDRSAGWLPAVDGGFIELSAPSVSEVVPRLAGGRLAQGGRPNWSPSRWCSARRGTAREISPPRWPGSRCATLGCDTATAGRSARIQCCWTCSKPASMRPWARRRGRVPTSCWSAGAPPIRTGTPR